MTVRVSVNHQRLVCLENSRIEPTPEQVRPNFWNWKESEGGVQHRFLCHVVARNLPAEPRNLHAELLNFLSQNLAKNVNLHAELLKTMTRMSSSRLMGEKAARLKTNHSVL